MGNSRDGDYGMLTVDGKSLSYRQPWVAVISDSNTLIQAAVDGMGIAMIPSIFVNPHVNSGNLVKIENVAEFPIVNIYGMYPTRKHVPYRLSLFLEHLRVNFVRIVTP
jgi:LysR family transcriptional regulator for bpeEF and oprC